MMQTRREVRLVLAAILGIVAILFGIIVPAYAHT